MLALGAAALLVVAVLLAKPLSRPDGDDTGKTARRAATATGPSAGSAALSPSGTASLGARPGGGTTASPRPGPTRASAQSPSRSAFPNADNTGVPTGVQLKDYGGPCTITRDGVVIDGRTVRCELVIKAQDVTIKRSKIIGTVRAEGRDVSVQIEDSEVAAGSAYAPAVGLENVTIRRSEIRGGQTSVNCYRSCLVADSWLHGQYLPEGGDWHLDAFLSNGGSDIQLIHNRLACDPPTNSSGGGCTAAAAIFGDFGPNSHYLLERNLFVASEEFSYCLYGGTDPKKPYGTQVEHIVVVNNVFERGRNGKCGFYGPVTSFDTSRPGNLWRDNVWDDGTPVPPSL